MIEHLCWYLAVVNLYSFIGLVCLRRRIPSTMAERTLPARRGEMPIRCRYIPSLHSSPSYFLLNLSPQDYSGIYHCSQLERLKSRNLISVAR